MRSYLGLGWDFWGHTQCPASVKGMVPLPRYHLESLPICDFRAPEGRCDAVLKISS